MGTGDRRRGRLRIECGLGAQVGFVHDQLVESNVEIGPAFAGGDVASYVVAGDDMVVSQVGEGPGASHFDDHQRLGRIDLQNLAAAPRELLVKTGRESLGTLVFDHWRSGNLDAQAASKPQAAMATINGLRKPEPFMRAFQSCKIAPRTEYPRQLRLQEHSSWQKRKIIAVVGATGAQGGGLVRAILADRSGSFAARAITRKPDSEKARALAALGAEVVAGDADDAPSLDRAFAGAYGAYCVTNFWEHFSAEREAVQATALARATARPASSMSSGRPWKTRANGCRSTTGACRRFKASTKCRTSTPRERWIACSPPRRHRRATCSPPFTGRTSSTSAWDRARVPMVAPRARAAAWRRQAAGYCRGRHRQVCLRYFPAWSRRGRSAFRSHRRDPVRRRDGDEVRPRARSQGRLSGRAVRRLSGAGISRCG